MDDEKGAAAPIENQTEQKLRLEGGKWVLDSFSSLSFSLWEEMERAEMGLRTWGKQGVVPGILPRGSMLIGPST